MASALTKSERLSNALRSARNQVKESARLGSRSMLTVGGGVVAGWCAAKYPTFANTNVSTATAVGIGLVGAGLSGLADNYSDELAAIGAGMLAAQAKEEAERYFND